VEDRAPAADLLGRRRRHRAPSTTALGWHLLRDQAGRANWDSLPLHGENLFSLAGPPMSDDPTTTAAVQASWEDVLLPAA
jgi:hypothetical protein